MLYCNQQFLLSFLNLEVSGRQKSSAGKKGETLLDHWHMENKTSTQTDKLSHIAVVTETSHFPYK